MRMLIEKGFHHILHAFLFCHNKIFFVNFLFFFLDCLLIGDFWYGFRLVISPLCSTKFFLLKYGFRDKKMARPPTVHCVAMLSEHEFLVFESHVQYP